MTINEALAERRAAEPGEPIPYTHLAEKHNVWRSTLSRRDQGIHASREDKAHAQQKLTPQQEAELVTYIEGLTIRHLPPTRTMIKNYAKEIAGVKVSDTWVTRFPNRNSDKLTSQWTTGMDSERHNADPWRKYEQYFNLMYQKIKQYRIEPQHTYNMDEKGFTIRKIGRSKRIFSKPLYKQKGTQQAI
jgi:hypothetical protein